MTEPRKGRVPVKTVALLRQGFVAWNRYWRLIEIKRVRGVTMYVIRQLDGTTDCKPRAAVLEAAWRPES